MHERDMKFCTVENVIVSRQPQCIGNSTNFCYKPRAFASVHSIRQNCNACSAVLMTRHSIRMHQGPLDVATLNTRIIASLSHASLYKMICVRHIETLLSFHLTSAIVHYSIYLYLYTLNVHEVKKGVLNEIKRSIKFSINFLLNFRMCYNCSISA